MNEAVRAEEAAPRPVLGFPISADTTIHLDACAPFERIAVNTRSSSYELVVLSGRDGEVLVRGGRFFPEFRRAILFGSTAGGSALKLRTIEVGLRMELHVDKTAYVTTPVQTLSRDPSAWTWPDDGGAVSRRVAVSQGKT